MWARIDILCFAASYSVVLALEATRIYFRSTIRQAILIGFAAAGFFAHSAFLAYRSYQGNLPLSSSFDWYLVAAWVLAAVYLYLSYYHPKQAIGVFILPLVLGLVGVAYFWADRHPFPQQYSTQVWGSIHGLFILASTISIFIGFMAGVMYLVQSHRLKHRRLGSERFQLPSLEWLQHTNARAIVVSALLLTVGLLAGAVLNMVNRSQQRPDQLAWTDPVIWSSSIMLGWLLLAAVFNLVYKPARLGRKVAYLTLASFLFLVLVLGLKLWVPTDHAPSPTTASKPSRLEEPLE